MPEKYGRHVHLDFHNSELIPGIGDEFDPVDFVETLQRAHVNSITCFTRCHHGWMYYNTKRFPERRHPHMTRNLLEEQIEACHRADIRVGLYTTVQFDWYTAKLHPEWLVQDENGCIVGTKPFEAGFYRFLCLNTPFVDFLAEHVIEVCETLPTDGLGFDIVSAHPCCCRWCIAGMQRDGLDPSDSAHRARYAEEVQLRFQERLFEVVHSRVPEASIGFNAGHIGPKTRNKLHTYTSLGIESLPSGGWGYMHFPTTQRFARTLGLGTGGGTGRFHSGWGDFHSLKNPAALEFECLNMLSLGARCAIGDQLHPGGKIDHATYDLIGEVFAKVEAAEPWCEGAVPQVDLGVLTPEEFSTADRAGSQVIAMGATRMLQELHQQFDVLDSQSDFAKYQVLILPDEIVVDEALAAKLSAYLAGGGSLIASHRSGLNPAGNAFAVPELGVSYVGPSPFSPDFIVPGQLGEGLRDTIYVMYLQGLEVAPAAGAGILSTMVRPYFNRTWEHFCSHRQTPAQGPADYPGVVRTGRCIYFMHPIFSQYQKNAPLWCKRLLQNALNLLLPEPLIRTNAPSMTLITVNAQPAQQREVVHVLHYVPERRGVDFDILEDVLPLHEVQISLRTERAASQVTLEPQGTALEFELRGGRLEFVIPKVLGHQMVVVTA